jgi:hypothetical protein
VRRVWALFIAQLIRLVVAIASSGGALEIVGQQLRDNSIICANAFGPLALHVDHELRRFVVRGGPMALLGLLGIGGGHKDYDARYEAHYYAHRVQNSVTHRPSGIRVTILPLIEVQRKMGSSPRRTHL